VGGGRLVRIRLYVWRFVAKNLGGHPS